MLLLADEALSGGHSQIGLSEWTAILLRPSLNSIPDIMAPLFISLFGDDRDRGKMAGERD